MPRDLVQAAIVALLCERECHGYELLSRLDELGICPGTVALYRTLRSMEGDGTVCSSWECPARGPARRTYTPTDGARCRLAGVLDAAMEDAERQRATVTRLLELTSSGTTPGSPRG
jgi:DNA-binding PadR family transcriptional regulator